MFIVSVMYPAGSKFDLDYYTSKHMPLVQQRWGAMGLKDVSVVKGTGSPSGSPTYQIMAMLTWDSAKDWQQAAGAHASEIMGDIKNFTDAQPVVQFNETITA